jgi:periplasmic divalent cation tolerance protein
MPEKSILIISTFPEVEMARTAIRALVGEHLAACGTMLPGAESIYAWKGAIESAQETVVLLKAPESCYPAIEQRLRQLHPYDVPEVIGVDISQGHPAYLEWIHESCPEPVNQEAAEGSAAE